ncbi:MAG: cbb3-type cytochrome c oxidase subunit I, partial [Saprospiraceae bacterium]
FPKMFGRFMNDTLGKLHFWGTIIGAYSIFWPMHYIGMAGVPRRYYRFDTFQAFGHFSAINKFMTIAAFVVFACQIVFIINFFYSIWKGKKVTNRNPYQANTLEWTTETIIPGHGNWVGNIPVVHRWPYDYNKDEREFIPQYVPMGPEEKDESH